MPDDAAAPADPVPAAPAARPWWHEAVGYQIYPRSFAGTTDRGIDAEQHGQRAALRYVGGPWAAHPPTCRRSRQSQEAVQ